MGARSHRRPGARPRSVPARRRAHPSTGRRAYPRAVDAHISLAAGVGTDYVDLLDRVVELARKRDVSPAQVALAWLLHQPTVTAPVIGASRLVQLDEALSALELSLSQEECRSLEEPYEPRPDRGFL
jgi:aryl-alcohol dehydrogenase-like predicted oxidoreductase